jgi:hypothetical protein
MASIARVIFGAVGQSAAFCQSEQELRVDRRQQLEGFQRLRDGQLFRQQQNTAVFGMDRQVAGLGKAGELQRGAGNGKGLVRGVMVQMEFHDVCLLFFDLFNISMGTLARGSSHSGYRRHRPAGFPRRAASKPYGDHSS